MVMFMCDFDESEARQRLSRLSRRRKTAFAAANAERLFPFARRHFGGTGSSNAATLVSAMDHLWDALSGIEADLHRVLAELQDLNPPEDTTLSHVASDAISAAVYAIETWLNDDSQRAALTARQCLAAADVIAQESIPDFKYFTPEVESRLRNAEIVRHMSSLVAADLAAVERETLDPAVLRLDASLSMEGYLRS